MNYGLFYLQHGCTSIVERVSCLNPLYPLRLFLSDITKCPRSTSTFITSEAVLSESTILRLVH